MMKINLLNKYILQLNKYDKAYHKKLVEFKRDYLLFSKLLKDKSFLLNDNYPCINDKSDESGVAKGAYFHQDLFVASQIFIRKPVRHVDIGSRIDGFVAHVATYREIEVFDIRKLESCIEKIHFKQLDLMSLEDDYLNYCDSISCLHVLEHFGLGRYGDKIDPDGHLKGFMNITKILKKNGTFYFSVPMGIQRIEFNAHRIFNLQYLLDWICKYYVIETFSYIDDMGEFHKNIKLNQSMIDTSCNCNHGCAVFILLKK